MIEKPVMVKLNCNKQMPYNIEWLKKFLTQIEKIRKIERGGGTDGNVDNNIATDRGTEINEKDVVKKKKFKNILKWYNKKKNNIKNVWNNKKKKKKKKKKINKIFKKKKKKIKKI